jgi:phosphatidylinositol alpha 1,6-mannosyltransferase
MRVAIVSESFLPQVNGVSSTVRHILDRLVESGHQAMVLAPGCGDDAYRGAPVVRVRSVRLPRYPSFPLGLPDPAVRQALERFRPDVVHLASPVLLGACGLRAARRLGVPTVAVYQTDLSGFAGQYAVPAGTLLDRWTARLHRGADRTLVPSGSSWAQLEALGVGDLHLWRRGVDLTMFDPDRRSRQLHDTWARVDAAGGPRTVVGFVGRLAREKQVRRLLEVARVPGIRLVVVGDGPERPWLQARLPDAVFTGMLGGAELARAFASLDVFVHTGTNETFCQTVQEAQASGVPVVAPASGGPLDLVTDGVSGLLYDAADPRGLRRAVATAVGDPALRTRMADAGRAAVAGRSWAGVVDQLVSEHYLGVLGQPVAAALPSQRELGTGTAA